MSRTTLHVVRTLRALGVASGCFLSSFALHILGGATGQDWLFAIAVALIFLTAAGFPAIALVAAGARTVGDAPRAFALACAAGLALTTSALWAANGRAIAWWTLPAAAALVALATTAALTGLRWRRHVPGGVGRARAAR